MGKSWIESKTIWGGLLLVAIGIVQYAKTGSVNTDALMSIAAGLGLIGLRTAKEPIQKE